MPQDERPTLKRSLGLFALTLYGVGDILGAGIYALIGEVAGTAGRASWLSFLIAMCAAGLTGLSYAELAGRHPRSGGEALFTLKAFHQHWLAFLIGWLVLCSGLVSMSAVAHACSGYLQGLWPALPAWTVWLLFVGFVSGLNFWGIRQSSTINIIFTLTEVSGLLLVIVVGIWAVMRDGAVATPQPITLDLPWSQVLGGAGLAFFAYIGFEDMINVAEEVKQPERAYPRAILYAVAICGSTYLAVNLLAIAVVPIEELSRSSAPLLEVVRRASPAVPPWLFTLVAVIAVTNTGLLNSIMASRLLYGMANEHLLPHPLGRIHPQTHTPHIAILVLAAASLGLIFSGTLTGLASTTSLLLLIVFSVVNASLLKLHRQPADTYSGFRVPAAVPVLAIIVCAGMAVFIEPTAWAWGSGLILCGGILAAAKHRTAA